MNIIFQHHNVADKTAMGGYTYIHLTRINKNGKVSNRSPKGNGAA